MNEILDEMTLKDLILIKFPTLSAFAEKLGWSKQKLQYKLDNREAVSLTEAEEMAKMLEVELNASTIPIFLRSKRSI